MHNKSKIQHINSIKEVDQFLQSKKTTVIDFSAEWCGPCKMLGPRFESVANDTKHNNINFIKVDIDKAKELANKYEIQSIPALIYFNKEGKEVKKTFGLVSEKDMTNTIEEIEK
ncbi:thioredoxin [Spiroplasma endosymbiont of Notiophilus biguttatus]|uniref:thioredoxin n=1 Tax=Spiroplasma endosymbiont of Notiophilus biguttatus TaxID=3066285 RepID=UPI00313B97C9